MRRRACAVGVIVVLMFLAKTTTAQEPSERTDARQQQHSGGGGVGEEDKKDARTVDEIQTKFRKGKRNRLAPEDLLKLKRMKKKVRPSERVVCEAQLAEEGLCKEIEVGRPGHRKTVVRRRYNRKKLGKILNRDKSEARLEADRARAMGHGRGRGGHHHNDDDDSLQQKFADSEVGVPSFDVDEDGDRATANGADVANESRERRTQKRHAQHGTAQQMEQLLGAFHEEELHDEARRLIQARANQWCSDPGVPHHGRQDAPRPVKLIAGVAHFSPGDVLDFSCASSYDMVGSKKRVCVGGVFDGVQPRCLVHYNPEVDDKFGEGKEFGLPDLPWWREQVKHQADEERLRHSDKGRADSFVTF